jgi:hypothetical protein
MDVDYSRGICARVPTCGHNAVLTETGLPRVRLPHKVVSRKLEPLGRGIRKCGIRSALFGSSATLSEAGSVAVTCNKRYA